MDVTPVQLLDLAITELDCENMDPGGSSRIVADRLLREDLLRCSRCDPENEEHIATHLPTLRNILHAYAERVAATAVRAENARLGPELEEIKRTLEEERKALKAAKEALLEKKILPNINSPLTELRPTRISVAPPAWSPLHLRRTSRLAITYLTLSHATLLALSLWFAIRYLR